MWFFAEAQPWHKLILISDSLPKVINIWKNPPKQPLSLIIQAKNYLKGLWKAEESYPPGVNRKREWIKGAFEDLIVQ